MGFRIAHLSDIHAGYSSGRSTTSEGVNVRADDGYRALKFLIDDVLDVQPDCVLICGDVFHTPTPQQSLSPSASTPTATTTYEPQQP